MESPWVCCSLSVKQNGLSRYDERLLHNVPICQKVTQPEGKLFCSLWHPSCRLLWRVLWLSQNRFMLPEAESLTISVWLSSDALWLVQHTHRRCFGRPTSQAYGAVFLHLLWRLSALLGVYLSNSTLHAPYSDRSIRSVLNSGITKLEFRSQQNSLVAHMYHFKMGLEPEILIRKAYVLGHSLFVCPTNVIKRTNKIQHKISRQNSKFT